ncbi:hypothetical protein SU90_00210 [Neisseria meningitidis]|nr:hypothetical protein [Neisseria meningitidis]
MFPVIPSKTENRKQRRKLKIPSFPRRRESGISMPQEFIGKNQNPSAVIPTKVGRESGISMPQEFIGKNQNPSAVIPTKVGI